MFDELPWGQRSCRVHERSKPMPELEPVWAFGCGDCTSLHTVAVLEIRIYNIKVPQIRYLGKSMCS